ncbi:MAG: metallophosphoesterase family protein [Candidatus Jordarchaeum sp.]|uniref:metallophosphoesterase family protein n=1 Tax=Candidatus Jordarchaeum sp. TaxID=2823881 RepID=UPI00404A87C7
MKIAAVSDIHSPKNIELLNKALSKIDLSSIDLFILAGDLIYKGKLEEVDKVIKALKVDCPVIAVFGNEEYENLHEDIRKRTSGKIRFLEEETYVLEVEGETLGVVGSKGSLDRPTFWQRKNMSNIWQTYNETREKVGKLVSELKTDYKCLLLHYAPTYETLVGEKTSQYPELGSKKYEKLLYNNRLDLVIHGHAHKGKSYAEIASTPIYNVALPLKKRITVIELPLPVKPTSLDFYIKEK